MLANRIEGRGNELVMTPTLAQEQTDASELVIRQKLLQ